MSLPASSVCIERGASLAINETVTESLRIVTREPGARIPTIVLADPFPIA
jgi:hypothetical protein